MSASDNSESTHPIDNDSVCVICGGSPCEWAEYGEELLGRQSLMVRRGVDENGEDSLIDSTGRPITNKKMRLYMYRLFTYLKFGHLGRGNRIPIPSCVTTQIRNRYPDQTYTEFKEACDRNLIRANERRRQDIEERRQIQEEEEKQESDKDKDEGDESYRNEEEESEDDDE